MILKTPGFFSYPFVPISDRKIGFFNSGWTPNIEKKILERPYILQLEFVAFTFYMTLNYLSFAICLFLISVTMSTGSLSNQCTVPFFF
jgi:hypothetical protein